ncbi:class I SAM-dependent methyltransferase [Corynebacterium frankenforstense]|uniref:class I SAM-dependent methyltransferase n=1 Tax=Corynebacterium frankenforstense TaxID=1230998 RepID=UPI0026F179DA|nr:class I SAM-dependent methyltransferase [Corynebacterium frankenforstense]
MSDGQQTDRSAAGGVTGGGTLFDAGGDYATFRPDYPAELSGRLAEAAPGRGLAVDVGCGTGQLTARLAEHFQLTVGLDPATTQVRHGTGAARYVAAAAEQLPLPGSCADLITVAQAAHWVDLPGFFAEAGRIAKPAAPVALVSYGVAEPGPGTPVAEAFREFYYGPFHRFWDPRRRLVEENLRSVEVPLERTFREDSHLVREMDLHGFAGYLGTWSALRTAREEGEGALMDDFLGHLAQLWGDPATVREVRWPLVVLGGYAPE